MKPTHNPLSFREQVYRLIQQIPPGRVAAYSDVAAALGHPHHARQVGFALSGLPESRQNEVPWQRVINAQGKISGRGNSYRAVIQEQMLHDEGLPLTDSGQVLGWSKNRFQAFQTDESDFFEDR